VAFRIHDLMTDVLSYQMANPRCTCQISVEIQREPGLPGEVPDNVPNEELDCHETLLPSADCPAEEELTSRAAQSTAHLAALRSELRRALHA
jgi:hypothetical protein